MNRLLLTSSLFSSVMMMADGIASGPAPELADPNLYREVPPSTAKVKLGGKERDVVASYAKRHEDAAGGAVSTHLHIICHLGTFVLARAVADQSNTEADTHAIDPNVPAEIADHLAHLSATSTEPQTPVDGRGVPAGSTAQALPVAAPVSEFPPSPAPEPIPAPKPETVGSSAAGDPASTETDPNQKGNITASEDVQF